MYCIAGLNSLFKDLDPFIEQAAVCSDWRVDVIFHDASIFVILSLGLPSCVVNAI